MIEIDVEHLSEEVARLTGELIGLQEELRSSQDAAATNHKTALRHALTIMKLNTEIERHRLLGNADHDKIADYAEKNLSLKAEIEHLRAPDGDVMEVAREAERWINRWSMRYSTTLGHIHSSDLITYLAHVFERRDAAAEERGKAEQGEWLSIADFNEDETRVYVSDGKRVAVAYLSKWASLWYFDCNQKACNWHLTHYRRIALPGATAPLSSERQAGLREGIELATPVIEALKAWCGLCASSGQTTAGIDAMLIPAAGRRLDKAIADFEAKLSALLPDVYSPGDAETLYSRVCELRGIQDMTPRERMAAILAALRLAMAALESVEAAARAFLRQTVKQAWKYPDEEMIALDDALLRLQRLRSSQEAIRALLPAAPKEV